MTSNSCVNYSFTGLKELIRTHYSDNNNTTVHNPKSLIYESKDNPTVTYNRYIRCYKTKSPDTTTNFKLNFRTGTIQKHHSKANNFKRYPDSRTQQSYQQY